MFSPDFIDRRNCSTFLIIGTVIDYVVAAKKLLRFYDVRILNDEFCEIGKSSTHAMTRSDLTGLRVNDFRRQLRAERPLRAPCTDLKS